jgi:hypothetical protein
MTLTVDSRQLVVGRESSTSHPLSAKPEVCGLMLTAGKQTVAADSFRIGQDNPRLPEDCRADRPGLQNHRRRR